MNITELEALVAKWEGSAGEGLHEAGRVALRLCAAQLRAALAKQPEQGGEVLCGCGRPAEYEAEGGGRCCNKYSIKCQPTAVLAARGQEGWNVTAVSRDFRFNADHQCHVPTVTVEFEPVPVGAPNDAKGWRDRDALFAHLAAAPSPESAGGGSDGWDSDGPDMNEEGDK